MTLQSYIQRGVWDGVTKQKRSAKGKTGSNTSDQDSGMQTCSVNTHTSVFWFST